VEWNPTYNIGRLKDIKKLNRKVLIRLYPPFPYSGKTLIVWFVRKRWVLRFTPLLVREGLTSELRRKPISYETCDIIDENEDITEKTIKEWLEKKRIKTAKRFLTIIDGHQ
jgi:hypothetical protein